MSEEFAKEPILPDSTTIPHHTLSRYDLTWKPAILRKELTSELPIMTPYWAWTFAFEWDTVTIAERF
jgi:hypothetical protein